MEPRTVWRSLFLEFQFRYRYSRAMARPRGTGTRVNLTLPDEVLAVLDRIADAVGQGRATVIRAWMEEGLPQLVEMADALELAKRSPTESLKAIADSMRSTVAHAEQLELDIRKNRRAMMRKKRGRAT